MSYVTVIKSVQLSTLGKRFELDSEDKITKCVTGNIWEGKFSKPSNLGYRSIWAEEDVCLWREQSLGGEK